MSGVRELWKLVAKSSRFWSWMEGVRGQGEWELFVSKINEPSGGVRFCLGVAAKKYHVSTTA